MEKFCPACRTANPPEAMFCRSCAASLASAPASFQTPQQQQAQWTQPQPFGGPLTAPARPPEATGNRPLIALVLVVAGLFCCGPFTTVPGAILGWMEMTAIKEGRAPQSGMTMAQIAFWAGIVLTVLTSIGIVVGILFGLASGGF
jgi:uncharacterized membrane protein